MPKHNSTLSRWLQEHRQLGDSVITLESDGNSGIFQVTSSYYVNGVKVSNYPMYYVWDNDKMVWHTSSYKEAYLTWDKYTENRKTGVA